MPAKQDRSSQGQSEAWQAGMERSRAVGRYLDALIENKPRRGRKRTPERVRTRLAEIEAQLPDSSGVARLRLMQEHRNLEKVLADLEKVVDLAALEEEFVKHAKAFTEKEGIEYSTWVEFGVPREVLARADIRP